MNQLAKIVQESGLEPQTGNYLKEKFLPFFDQAQEWKEKAESIVVTDASQTADMKMARTARLKLKEIRVNADKTRKALKEDSLRYGRAVQGVYNVIEYLVVPIEKHLEEQEKFVEIQEAKRRAELQATREMDLQPYAEFVPPGVDLGAMKDTEFSNLLTFAKQQLDAKIEAERKAEEERIAREKAEAEERERIRKENEKLKAEAAEREKQLAAERAAAEAERRKMEEAARKEREAREKLEAEAKAKAAAEAAAERAAAEAAAKAAEAPDYEKLERFADAIIELSKNTPDLKSPNAKKTLEMAVSMLMDTAELIREQVAVAQN